MSRTIPDRVAIRRVRFEVILWEVSYVGNWPTDVASADASSVELGRNACNNHSQAWFSERGCAGTCSSSLTRSFLTTSSSISTRRSRARPTLKRPTASAPIAIAPRASAPRASAPRAVAPDARAPVAVAGRATDSWRPVGSRKRSASLGFRRRYPMQEAACWLGDSSGQSVRAPGFWQFDSSAREAAIGRPCDTGPLHAVTCASRRTRASPLSSRLPARPCAIRWRRPMHHWAAA